MNIFSAVKETIFGKPEPTDGDMYIPADIPLPKLDEFSQPEFQEAHYRQSELNIKVESKEAMMDSVRQSHLSLRCKNAWFNIIETYYDRNVILSDLTGKKVQGGSSSDEQVQIAYWRAKIDVMGVVRCNSWKSDRLNPEFTRIEQLVLSQIWYRLKRAKGKDRESIISRRVDINYNATQKISRPEKGEK